MKEMQVCTRIVNSLKRDGHFAFKIPDSSGSSFSRKKGVDIFAAINKQALLIEVKINPSLPKTRQSFLNLFTKDQLDMLNKTTAEDTAQCFALLCVFKNAVKAKDRIHNLYVVPWQYPDWDTYLHWDKDSFADFICPYKKEMYDLTELYYLLNSAGDINSRLRELGAPN